MFDELVAYGGAFSEGFDLRLVFGCCEPHLLSLFLKMGCRPYAEHNINSPSAGYLIPIISFVPDADALRGVGPATAAGELPACVERVLARSGSVRSEALSSADEYWGEVRRMLDELDAQKVSAFDGFTDDEAQRCIARSTIIECTRVTGCSSVVVRRATSSSCWTARSRSATTSTIVNVLSAGDAFGEMAFLLERPRSFDVDAATDDTRILSLSEECAAQDDRRRRDHRRQVVAQPLEDAVRPPHPSELTASRG